MKKLAAVQTILSSSSRHGPINASAEAYAPSNIALCKYWGKRDAELNLPVTSSLSISLGDKGAKTTLKIHQYAEDTILLNGKALSIHEKLGKKVCDFLDLFREQGEPRLQVAIAMNIPLAAGLASSACGFASLALALDQLYGWNLPLQKLSMLARLGSGSATRSLWPGFVEWHAGSRSDGMDSFAEPINTEWPDLCLGLLILSEQTKPIPSREAMNRTVATSLLYQSWPEKVNQDLSALKTAIKTLDFSLLGATAEANAMNMHATMLSAWPPVCYYLPETIAAMQRIWQLRAQGLEVYFTQDAGPNLKLLFKAEDQAKLVEIFPGLEVIQFTTNFEDAHALQKN